jgi:phospholipase C
MAVTTSTSVTITATYNGTSQTATLTVTPVTLSLLSHTGWSVKYADSQELAGEDGAAMNAIDGNSSTFWHTGWSSSQDPLPHEIQVDLGASHSIGGFRYLPRQDGSPNGRIGQYEFYISQDGITWGAAVATGTFANSATEKEVKFTLGTARYVRLRALTEANGAPWTSMAELNVLVTQ